MTAATTQQICVATIHSYALSVSNPHNLSSDGRLPVHTIIQDEEISKISPPVSKALWTLPLDGLWKILVGLTDPQLFERAINESITISDAVTRFKLAIRAIAQSITVSDAISRIKKAIRRIGDVSILFDGSNDLLDCGNHADLWSGSLSKFSFSFWVFPTSMGDGNNRVMVEHGGGTAHGFRSYIASTGSNVVFNCYDSGAVLKQSIKNGELETGEWNHVICTYDKDLGSANVKVYVNNIQGSTTANLTETMTKSAVLNLGETTTDLQGFMKDFRFWNSIALDSTQRANVYSGSPLAPTPDYWLKMDEGTGTPVDSIGSKTTTLFGPTWNGSLERITISDSISKVIIRVRGISESISISDSISRLKTAIRDISQSISVSDSLTRVATKLRGISESIGISDSISRIVTKVRGISESVSISDSLSTIAVRVRGISQSISVSDSISRLKTAIRGVSESVSVSDSIARMKTAIRGISQSITLSDALARLHIPGGGTLYEVACNVSISVSDSVSRMVTRVRTMNESVTIIDSITRMKTAIRSVSENVSITDIISKSALKIRSITQNITLSDIVTGVIVGAGQLFHRTINETITISDSILLALFKAIGGKPPGGNIFRRKYEKEREKWRRDWSVDWKAKFDKRIKNRFKRIGK